MKTSAAQQNADNGDFFIQTETGISTGNQYEVMSGSEIFIRSLLDLGVDTIFGYPGGVVLGLYEKLYDHPELRHILVRHEQGGTHAADGYARATGKPGVMLVTSGPGGTNTVTGIANAYMDSIPIIVFTGQVHSSVIGYDAFQEADIIGITRPITKHSYQVRDTNQLSRVIAEAFYIAMTGRPGPVVVELPKDVLSERGVYRPVQFYEFDMKKPRAYGDRNEIDRAAELIGRAKRPVIYAGGGIISGNASNELREFALQNRIPVTTTLLGLGSFPERDPLSLGMLGMHGTYYANMAVHECDVLIAIGARFDDRVTGKISGFSPYSKKIQIDIDPASINKNVHIDVPIVGYAKRVLKELIIVTQKPDTQKWIETIAEWKREHSLRYQQRDDVIMPQQVIQKISEVTNGEAVIVSDVGQNQMWTAQYYQFNTPRSYLSSGGLGTMGFGVPAALGAAIGRPDKTVWCITGDGGFQMTSYELITAAAHNIPLKVAILNNGYLGMVRQWQELFFGKKYSHSVLRDTNPDFVKLAESYGAAGLRVVNPNELESVLKRVMKITNTPVVVDIVIAGEENCYPMVPVGAALNEMIEWKR
jgi:acetolactate synthase-1/2/3 large subunit